jgi:hypothetical protein
VAERPKRFAVGTREYDPVKLGYQQDPSKAPPPYATPTYLDSTLPGNSNAGHDWKVDTLTDDQRYAIIEYLKTF